MRHVYTKATLVLALALMVGLGARQANAQFLATWLDIGEYHHTYVESGAKHEAAPGMNWPAYMRESGSLRAKAFWVGVKDWTGPDGINYPHFVSRIGPRTPGGGVTFPVELKLISKYEDSEVEVDGVFSFDKVAVVDEVDPNLPADRMIRNVHNTLVGVTVERNIYAWSNEHHDDYHIIEYIYTNTGNTDEDEEIELPGQTLNDAMFFRIHRWRGISQEAWNSGNAQAWGKFSMVDVVGDGHMQYPVDFTAQYLWPGYNPDFTDWNNLGGPLIRDSHWTVASGDSLGRLSGGAFVGRAVIHADNSAQDKTYDPMQQPHTTGFMDQDEALTSDGSSHRDYYELGILTRERQDVSPNVPQSRMWPHYADRIEPTGQFWNPTNNASSGKQGGHAATTGYGPYDLAFGESVRIVIVESVNGLSMEGRLAVGRAYKLNGQDDNAIIEYDANGDGVISRQPFDYDEVGYDKVTGPTYGSEAMTKNQWVMTARDSLFWTFEKAIKMYRDSGDLSSYPIQQAPYPPRKFSVFGRPNKIDVTWESLPGGPSITGWELYRTSRFPDNVFDLFDKNNRVYPAGVKDGYELVATLGPGASSYEDTDVIRGTDYYYFLQAVGESQSVDPYGITGTPSGAPLRSSRYYAQTYQPVNLKRPPGASIESARVVPNPVNLGSDQTIRFDREDEIAFFDIPGECTIKIFTEIGEFVHQIEHTDGSGDEKWNLTTSSRQLLVSGIYIAVIETPDGQRVFRKFTVIR
ncbi:MAG: hypothetical protein RhofKO_40060 [Rhodothermales bacterium]